ncbi:hypothetical protein TIFTF001_026478 [Ficus carica]|uniref:Uncharacterized protein n=1 Tax=Ficus carica TaxID=3494 RepID=A0AA88DLD1_FICCA|nr:hypothetical protein TIFTF001_026478 [Ficus carica]
MDDVKILHHPIESRWPPPPTSTFLCRRRRDPQPPRKKERAISSLRRSKDLVHPPHADASIADTLPNASRPLPKRRPLYRRPTSRALLCNLRSAAKPIRKSRSPSPTCLCPASLPSVFWTKERKKFLTSESPPPRDRRPTPPRAVETPPLQAIETPPLQAIKTHLACSGRAARRDPDDHLLDLNDPSRRDKGISRRAFARPTGDRSLSFFSGSGNELGRAAVR